MGMTLEAGKEMDRCCVIVWLNEVYRHPTVAFNTYSDEQQIEFAHDALVLLKEHDEEHRRLLFWLGKFCRHIDNGDAWLIDEENIAFFKEKMKQ